MSDLISRQAAIDALHTWFRDGFDEDKWWNSTHVLAAIEGLPPAQLGTNLAEVGTDCISRQDAIDAIYKRIHQIGYENDPWVLSIRQVIRELPPAQPKSGKWEYIKEHGQYECSECGEPTDSLVMGKPRWKYCPMCGSRNEVTE